MPELNNTAREDWTGFMVGTGRLLVFFLVGLSSGSLVGAQVVTGKLLGTVKDGSGAVLVGATVVITSPALIGGPSVSTTNSKGQYRFVNLAPGHYALEARLSGFRSYREEELRVVVGGTVERDVVLKLEGVSETVVVRGESPLVDSRRAGLSTNFGSEVLDNLPVRRNSAFDLMKSAPGVSAHRPSGTRKELSVFGSGVNENAFLLDGTNFTGPGAGEPVPFPDPDIVEEIEVLSLGASAEYGNIQGGVFNVVTKQGSNVFQFDASYYAQTQRLTSQPVLLDCNCPEGESGYTRNRYRDFSAHVGGPILQNRLWFFGGYQYQRDWEAQPGADPRFSGRSEADRVFGKITWEIAPRWRLQSSYHDDFWLSAGGPTASRSFETISTSEGHNPTSTIVQLTHVLSDDTSWEARVSRFVGPSDTTPNSGSLTIPGRINVPSGVFSDNSFSFGKEHRTRTSVQGKLSHYAMDLLAGDHDIELGVQYVVGAHESFSGYPGGEAYIDFLGNPFEVWRRAPWSAAGESRNLGAFAEDVVRLGERMTLSLGLRFDHTEAISTDVPARDVLGNETSETIEGLGTLYTWNAVSPRLGIHLELTEDGKTVLRAAYGRFYQGVFISELNAVHPGGTPETRARFDPSTGAYSNIYAVIDQSQIGLDPDTAPPHTDQLSIGLDREFATNIAMGVTYIKKKGRDFIYWEDVGGIYGEDTYTLEDGSTLPVFPLLNATSDRFFLLTNPPGFFLDYDGLLVTFQKRWSDRWQTFASYTLSEAVGLQARFASNEVGNSQTSSTFGFRTIAGDPNDLTNSTGNLRNDRTHMVRFQATVEIPEIDVLLGANFRYLTGKPWAGFVDVPLPQGTIQVLAEPRGARRLSSQSLLDLRVSKILRFQRRGRLEILVDVLNVFNETAEEGVTTENLASSNFAVGSTFVPPRRAMIGVKFSF